MHMSLVSIIIVNYRTPDLTIRCIDSVYATTKTPFEIIVVDNASGDNSQEKICTKFGDVVWIQNKRNEGFGRANNIGVANAKGDYVLLLNSDMVVADGTIDSCLEQIKKDNSIAAFTCKLVNIDGSNQNNLSRDIVDLKRNLNNNIIFVKIFGEISVKITTIRAIMGAFMLMRKSVFDEFGGFDPDFFMYFEEIDLCRRIVASGKYHFDYSEDVYAVHKHEGSSVGKMWNRRQRILSESLMVYKMYGYGGFAFYHFIQFNTVISNLIVSLFIKKYREISLLHFKAYMRNLPKNIVLPLCYSRKIGTGKRLLKV